jgi:predicted TIM-barrel fold metal-dependent hydrolase
MKFDAHQHFLKCSTGAYGWIGPEMEDFRHDRLAEDLLPVLSAFGPERIVFGSG